MPPPSYPASLSSLVAQQSFAPRPVAPMEFVYKPPKIRQGALKDSDLDEVSCGPWLDHAFPSDKRRDLQLCSGLMYNKLKDGWCKVWGDKFDLMQNLKNDGTLKCPDDVFREPSFERKRDNAICIYGRIWLFADCFLGWREGGTGAWLFFLAEGSWELQRAIPISLPLDNKRKGTLLRAMKSAMLGFEFRAEGKDRVEESWNGFQSDSASSASFPQASMLSGSGNTPGWYATM